ncbi:hypothetical protein OUY22_10020 [Nonomuraea sp. MCN248]|uniref:Uncharacterized protein n=1 Tax=Nonomuraea corallina TaxID=2989783 RepID=A0ABT4S999_9ACTN|nr:hypothetical protein [Nonomuraea corallina]MDA0633754.1 hypothetical protein [Nonomuraea corallina]
MIDWLEERGRQMSNARRSRRREKRRRARAAEQAAREKSAVRRLALYTVASVLVLGCLIYLVFPSVGVAGANGIASFVIFAAASPRDGWIPLTGPRAIFRVQVMTISGLLTIAFVLAYGILEQMG